MTYPEAQIPEQSSESEASIEKVSHFKPDAFVVVDTDSPDAALLWQVVDYMELTHFYILRVVGDPSDTLCAFRDTKVNAAPPSDDLDKLVMPKLKTISDDEKESLVMTVKIEEYIDSQKKKPERASELANDGAEDLGIQAVQEVVEEVVGDKEVLSEADHLKNIDELKKIEFGIVEALARASEVFRGAEKIDETFAQLLGNLQHGVGGIRALASFEGSGEDFRRRAKGLIDGLLNKSEKEFNVFRAKSLTDIQAHVFDVYSRTKAIEQYDKTYDTASSEDVLTGPAKEAHDVTKALVGMAQQLKPLTIGMQAPINASEHASLDVSNKLRNTVSEIELLINKSFRGPVDTADLMRIAAVFNEYKPDSPAITSLRARLKAGVQQATRVISTTDAPTI